MKRKLLVAVVVALSVVLFGQLVLAALAPGCSSGGDSWRDPCDIDCLRAKNNEASCAYACTNNGGCQDFKIMWRSCAVSYLCVDFQYVEVSCATSI